MAVTGQMLVPYVAPGIAAARRQLTRDMRAEGCVPSVVDDATLVLSELLSNAVKHARPLPSGAVLARWEIDAHGVRIVVSDGGATTRPVPANSSPRATGGRGLAIVAQLAVQWGVEGGSDGTTVWAIVPSS